MKLVIYEVTVYERITMITLHVHRRTKANSLNENKKYFGPAIIKIIMQYFKMT